MIRWRPTHWVILCCVGAVALPITAGVLLGLLIAHQFRPVTDRSLSALSESYNASGQDLFAQLAGAGRNRIQLAGERPADGNIVFSPYSLGAVMALALSGARGETAAEMAHALRQQLPLREVDGTNRKTLAIFERYGAKEGPVKLTTANAVALTKLGHLISNEYLAMARAHYTAEIFRDADVANINNWVSRKTEGKIERIIERLDPAAVAILLNAVYFKAGWQVRFDPNLTQMEPFAISPSETVSVPIMHRVGVYPMVAERGFTAIRVPYQDPQLHMVVVLPDQIDGLRELDSRLDGRTLTQLFVRLQRPGNDVDLALPRFKANFEVALKGHFRALGMIQAFDPAKADFSGMTGGSRGIFIEDIAHRAVIEVAEEGTEAAAATAAPTLTSGPQSFQVNRPFLFYIVDATTGTILFQGRIVDPR